MALAVFPDTDVVNTTGIPRDDSQGWGFALLVMTTITLFVRPADIIPAIENWPIYQILIAACLAVATRSIIRQLAHEQLAKQPVTACLFLLAVAIGLSHLSHGFVWGARTSMWEFCKLAVFYLLITGLINSPKRLVLFCKILVLSIATAAGLALLDRFEILSIAAFESVKDKGVDSENGKVLVERIRGTGIFQDPNDFGLILVTGVVLSCGFWCRPKAGWPRHFWFIPTCLLVSAIAMTQSRGAFLSLACAIPAAITHGVSLRMGLFSMLCLPPLAILFPGRMTDLAAIEMGTGQTRLQIWSESLAIWREYPMFGLGEGMLFEEIYVVTHNSFIQCFAELGLFGGTAFVSCFLAAGLGIWKRGGPQFDPASLQSSGRKDVSHLQTFIFAALAAYAAGMLTLSRQFVTPTYLILGLATAAGTLSYVDEPPWKMNTRFLLVASLISGLALLSFYVIVRIFVRW